MGALFSSNYFEHVTFQFFMCCRYNMRDFKFDIKELSRDCKSIYIVKIKIFYPSRRSCE